MYIRDFTENDRLALARIFLKVRVNTFYWLETESYQLEDFDAATAGEYILVAIVNEEPVGFIAAWKKDSFIHHLYVDHNHHQKGIGKALLAAAVKVLQQPVRLKCLSENKKALSFYKSQGWQFEMMGFDLIGKYYLLRNK
jgi:GNAT superfamily N-acetyltransferase